MSFSVTHIKTCLLLAGSIVLVSSCQDYEPFTEPEIKNVTYNREFEKTFGPVDPHHDWSMATRVTANIDLSHAPEGTYEVKIFSEKEGYLLTKAIVENSATLSFDAIKGETHVRILARKTSALGLSVINAYYPIVDGEVNTAKEGTRASTADNCQTTLGDQIDLGTKIQQGVATFQFIAANGAIGTGNFVTSLPTNDDIYYIAAIEGQDYSEGADGLYSVTRNGATSQMNMHEVGEIINAGSTFRLYEATTKTVYSDDQTNWKPEYDSNPNKQTEYEYSAQQGSWTGQNVDALPTNDNVYYITTIPGESYNNGDNGKYSVTYNGSTSNYNMYELADIISKSYRCYEVTGSGVSLSYWGTPAYYKVKRYSLDVDGYYIAPGTYVYPAYYKPTTENVTVKWAGDFYYLNDVYKSIDSDTQVKFEDLLPLVSSSHPDPIFHEQEDNRTKWEDVLDFNVELVLKEAGPMTYTYVFYGSIYHNMLGYFYWNETEGMTDAEKRQARINAPRYVLMNDTYPEDVQTETGKPNLQCYNDQSGANAHTPQGMSMPQWVDSGQEAHAGHYLQGTTYHMVYFGDDYKQAGSYEFPAGLHVAFFLLTKATDGGSYQNNKGTGLFYSIKDMNNDQEIMEDAQGNKTILNDKKWWAAENAQGEWDPSQERPNEGEVAAVFYSYKGNMVLGFEDDVDKDENDMLFLISAPVEPPVELTTEEENTWIVACEDLGGTYDYDFNDLVFEVGLHTTTTTTTTTEGNQSSSTVSFSTNVYLRPLAAGGTLPAHIYLGEQDLGEIHGLLSSGASTSTPINVGPKGISVTLTTDSIPVDTGEEVYADINAVLEDIKIVVTNEGDKDASEITFPNYVTTATAPQMLLLPKGWDWPSEQTCIYDVYPLFEQWAADKTKNGWIEDPDTNNITSSYYIVNPFK
ncbi:MAG: DUF4114 domain-containing protein [Bacteroidales bacterium]|nr:DUF4114 domain-containing protein [Bacteroidales bacterium]